ncbi:MAG: hypothetical protein Q9191_001565 [Dirinaria sp. TL-2023a]
MRVVLLAAALALPVLGVPTSPKKPTPSNVVANYDDLPQSLGLEPISVYKGLGYTGFNVITPGPQSQPVLVTPSVPNVLAADLTAQLTTGGGARISATYNNSDTYSFDLKSFFISCVIQTNSPVPAPSACRIQVSGVNAKTGVTSVQEIDYNLGTTLPARYLPVSFPVETFSGLSDITLTILEATTLPATTALGFDNFVFTAYKSS